MIGSPVLKPKRHLVVALVLLGISLGGALLAARVLVTATSNSSLAAYQLSESQRSLAAGDIEDAERRAECATGFAETADSYRSTAAILGVGAAAVGIPGIVLAIRTYRSPSRS